MHIIGVSGHAGAGKGTIADWLVAHRGYIEESFAGPIKAGLLHMLNLPIDSFIDRQKKESAVEDYGKSPREMAQTLGTEWGRELIHQDIWVIAARRRLSETPRLKFVFADVRFENEAKFIREHGMIVHVYRDGAVGDVGLAGHKSERGIEVRTGDVMISNGSSIEDLHSRLGALFPQPAL